MIPSVNMQNRYEVTMKEILGEAELAGLLREVAEELQIDLADAHADEPLVSLGMDSLTQFEFLTALEDKIGLRIPDDRIADIKTIKDVVDCLAALQRSQVGGRPARRQ
jgi:acyl carrier protein